MSMANELSDQEKEIIASKSGEYYDYTITNAPEREYMISYDKTLAMKMRMAVKDGKGGSEVHINFEQALEIIIQMDNITRGIPKVLYLVGWQYNGHDDKYPAWFEVNKALKRPQDATALDSYFWLRDEAAKYNTNVSVHINMQDAYMDSPLWETYTQNDLIAKNEDGSYYLCWGDSAYQVCYTKEWASGYCKKRIDRVIDMLDLQKSKTVHIDAFHTHESKYDGITREMEAEAMRKIFRYWRDKGVDVTSECQADSRLDPFIGLQPMAWWFDLSKEQRTVIHQDLACGGMPGVPWSDESEKEKSETGFLFGQNVQGEESFSSKNFVNEFKKDFCITTLQTYYQNLHKFQSYNKEENTTYYSNGFVINASDWTVKENGRLLRSGNDVFIPAAWRNDKEILAFSETGYKNKSWLLPSDWKDVKAVNIYTVTDKGLVPKSEKAPVLDMALTISLNPLEEVAVQPA